MNARAILDAVRKAGRRPAPRQPLLLRPRPAARRQLAGRTTAAPWLPACLVLATAVAAAAPPRPAPVGARGDYHVHINRGLALQEALAKSKADGIAYGLTLNGGLDRPAPNDAAAAAFLELMRPYPFFLAFEAEGREWTRLFSRATLEKFDYITSDAMTWTDDSGKRMRLWIPEEVGTISDPEKFMDTLVDRAARIFAEEPIDLFVNPTFIPDQIAADYDKLWTPARMKTLVGGLAANGIGLEINNRYRIPSRAFVMLAKEAGVKFACGTNNGSTTPLGRNEYCEEIIKTCDLREANFWRPPVEGRKAVQRKPLRK